MQVTVLYKWEVSSTLMARLMSINPDPIQIGQIVITRTRWQFHLRLRGEVLHPLENGKFPKEIQTCAAGIDIFLETIGGTQWHSIRPR